MPFSQTIAIVDDEPELRSVYKRYLNVAGFDVLECVNGVEAVEILPQRNPALIILDVDMPQMNGWKTLTALRERGCRQPILMVTVCAEPSHRVAGLENGADDYLAKPCDLAELLARVRALLRRPPLAAPAALILRRGEITIDFGRRQTTRASQPLYLTRKEYAVLELLAQHAGRPVTRELMLQQIWGLAADTNSHTVDTHIWRLRKKLGATDAGTSWIRNLPGMGYVLDEERSE